MSEYTEQIQKILNSEDNKPKLSPEEEVAFIQMRATEAVNKALKNLSNKFKIFTPCEFCDDAFGLPCAKCDKIVCYDCCKYDHMNPETPQCPDCKAKQK